MQQPMNSGVAAVVAEARQCNGGNSLAAAVAAVAAHSATAAGDGQGNGKGNGCHLRRTRGWHNERTERSNATTSWARGTSMIQFLSCDMNFM